MNPKKLLILSGIDVVFIYSVFYFLVYISNLVKGYITEIQAFGLNLQAASFSVQSNLSATDLSGITQQVDVINSITSRITLIGIGSFVLLFVAYCLIQSVQWSLIFGSFKKFRKYLIKFSCVSFGYFVFLAFFGYLLLVKLREFIMDYWFGKFFDYPVFLKMVGLSIVVLIVTHVILLCYIYLEKNDLVKACNYALVNSYRNWKLFLRFIGLVILSLLGIVLIFRAGRGELVYTLISLIIISLLFNKYRFYLFEKVKC